MHTPAFAEHLCSDVLRATDPAVSVCIVTYQQESYITQAVESVLAQETDFPFEVIVGDDGSTDRTPEILRSLQCRYPGRMRVYLHHGHYDGIPAKRNTITNLRAARGRYVALLDGDDYWISRDKLQRQVDHLEAHPELSFSFHDAETLFEDETDGLFSDQGASHDRLSSWHPETMAADTTFSAREVAFWQRDGRRFFIPASSIVFRRRLFDPVPAWFWTVWNGDIAMQLHLSRHGPAYYHHALLSCRRKNSGSMTVKLRYTEERLRTQIEQIALFCRLSPHYREQRSPYLYRCYREYLHVLRERNDIAGILKVLPSAAYHYGILRLRALRAQARRLTRDGFGAFRRSAG